jgi:hypothetical protein
MKKIFLLPFLLLLFAATAKSQTTGDTVYFNSKVKAGMGTGRPSKPFLTCDSIDISGSICCVRDNAGNYYYDVKPVINNRRSTISSWSIQISTGTVVSNFLPMSLGVGTHSVFQSIRFMNVTRMPLTIAFNFKYADGKSCRVPISLTLPKCGK